MEAPKLGRRNLNNLDPFKVNTISSLNIRNGFSSEELYELAKNIATYGQIQPIRVTYYRNSYTVVAGHTRLAACQLINKDPELRKLSGLEEEDIYPIVAMTISTEDPQIIAIIENAWRNDLNPVEYAKAQERLRNEGKTGVEIAEICRCTDAWVSTLKTMLDICNESELEAVANSDLSVARAIKAAKNRLYTDEEEEPKEKKQKPKFKDVKKFIESHIVPGGYLAKLYKFIEGDITESELEEELDKARLKNMELLNDLKMTLKDSGTVGDLSIEQYKEVIL